MHFEEESKRRMDRRGEKSTWIADKSRGCVSLSWIFKKNSDFISFLFHIRVFGKKQFNCMSIATMYFVSIEF